MYLPHTLDLASVRGRSAYSHSYNLCMVNIFKKNNKNTTLFGFKHN